MKKNSFFYDFFKEYRISDWIEIMDWIFDDNKFASEFGWEKGKLQKLTSAIKELDAVRNGVFVYNKRSEVSPGDYNRKKNRRKKSIIIMVTGQGVSRDLIRHIRNGIAHGRAQLCTRNGCRHLEIIDYGKFGEKIERSGQTAYILIPVYSIRELYDAYNRIQQY